MNRLRQLGEDHLIASAGEAGRWQPRQLGEGDPSAGQHGDTTLDRDLNAPQDPDETISAS